MRLSSLHFGTITPADYKAKVKAETVLTRDVKGKDDQNGDVFVPASTEYRFIDFNSAKNTQQLEYSLGEKSYLVVLGNSTIVNKFSIKPEEQDIKAEGNN